MMGVASPAANDLAGLSLDLRPFSSPALRFHLALIAGELAHREGEGATSAVLHRLVTCLCGGHATDDELVSSSPVAPIKLISPQAIIEQVSAETGVHVREILGPLRSRAITDARHEAMRRCRAEIGRHGGPRWSYPQISRVFGRDHTTVILGVRAAEARRAGKDGRQ